MPRRIARCSGVEMIRLCPIGVRVTLEPTIIYSACVVFCVVAGLLHDPPAKHTKDLQELLRECVEETEAGGRLQAVEEIVDILQVYIDE